VFKVKPSGLPSDAIAGDGVECDEQLPGDRHEGQLGRLSGVAESLVDRLHGGVEAGCGHRGEVEGRADGSATPADAAIGDGKRGLIYAQLAVSLAGLVIAGTGAFASVNRAQIRDGIWWKG